MSEVIRVWVLGICAVSLITAAATAMLGEGKASVAVRLAGTAAIVLVILFPLKENRPDLTDEFSAFAHRLAAPDVLNEMTAQAGDECARSIETYIAELAAEQNIVCKPQVDCRITDGAVYLETCRLEFSGTDEAARREFIQVVAASLGIDAAMITGV